MYEKLNEYLIIEDLTILLIVRVKWHFDTFVIQTCIFKKNYL